MHVKHSEMFAHYILIVVYGSWANNILEIAIKTFKKICYICTIRIANIQETVSDNQFSTTLWCSCVNIHVNMYS